MVSVLESEWAPKDPQTRREKSRPRKNHLHAQKGMTSGACAAVVPGYLAAVAVTAAIGTVFLFQLPINGVC